jgi:hypothetical protein
MLSVYAASRMSQGRKSLDDFLDLVLDEPVGEATQVGRRRAGLLALEVELAIDLDVGHDDREHLLVDIDSCDSVRHRLLLLGAESMPRRIIQGRELSPSLGRGLEDAHLFVQSRTLRTKQLLGGGEAASIGSR